MLDDVFSQFASDPTFDQSSDDAAMICDDGSTLEHGQIATAKNAVTFMTAGKAHVTLVSLSTNTRFTYRINTSDDGRMRFVSVLSGPDNNASYKYLGHVAIGREVYWHGRKSKIDEKAPSARAFAWAWRQLNAGNLPAQLQVWHEGRCGRCARRLTVPSSIATGFGPECAGKIGSM